MELVVPWGEPPKVRGGEGYLRRTAEKVPVKRSKRSGKSLQGSSGVFKSGADPFLPLLRVAVATCESDAEPRTRISHIRAVKRKKLERHEYRQQPSTPSQIIHAGRRNREFPARLHAVAKSLRRGQKGVSKRPRSAIKTMSFRIHRRKWQKHTLYGLRTIKNEKKKPVFSNWLLRLRFYQSSAESVTQACRSCCRKPSDRQRVCTQAPRQRRRRFRVREQLPLGYRNHGSG